MELTFEKYDELKLSLAPLEFWVFFRNYIFHKYFRKRMNVIAISKKSNILFIAAQNKIFSFLLQNDGKIVDSEHPKIYQINEEPEVLFLF